VLLLLHANRPVGVDRLAEALWPGRLPQSAAGNMRTYMSALRRVLCLGSADRLPRLTAGPGGYRLDLEPSELDVLVFDDLSARGRHALGNDDPAAAAGMLSEALGLWRGRPAEDVALDGETAGAVAELEERRLAAEEAWVDAQLMLGNDAELITRLRGLVARHPLREWLWGQLMTALYRTGRQAEALAAFQRLRGQVADELGVEPGPHLQRIQQQILRGDPLESTSPSAARLAPQVPVPPAQLPPDIASFTCRAAQLRRLDMVLAARGADDATSPVICAISGMAGVGKTALAVHWAHQVAGQFGDGQLYVNLRGFDPTGRVLSPAEAVRGFLDALGVAPERIPAGPAAQTGLYRSLLAGKRVLVLLDNARDAGQVRALLPGAPGCAALVTSRNRLAGLVVGENAYLLPLNPLSGTESRRLLANRTGPDRLAAEPHATEGIIALCSGLPLALVIVAAWAAVHPHVPLATLTGVLRRSRGLPDALDTADPATDVRAVLSWSYAQLSDAAARLFRLIGLHRGPDLSVPAAASLAGIPVNRVRPLIAELGCASLVTEPAPGRYTLHDLLRAYAGELALTSESDADRSAALHRLLDHYLHTAREADRLFSPHRDLLTATPPHPGTTLEDFASYQQALTWFDAEHKVLLAAVEHAARDGFDIHAWQLPCSLGAFLERRGHWHDWVATQQLAAAAARRLGDRAAQAEAHRSLGLAYGRLGRYDNAHAELRCALDLFRQLNADDGLAYTHRCIGFVFEYQGHYTESLEHSRRALHLYRRAGHEVGQARALNGIGWTHSRLGEHHQALACGEQALAVQERIGDRYGQAATWDSLGYAHHHLGHHEQAIACYQHSLTLAQDLGGRYMQAQVLTHLGDAHHAAGDTAAAQHAWRDALDLLDQLRHPEADEVRARLRNVITRARR
jgi:DNA-binding SARP family transcriptional activator/tetratricopeptide (TPR) repeat protein